MCIFVGGVGGALRIPFRDAVAVLMLRALDTGLELATGAEAATRLRSPTLNIRVSC